MRIVRPKYWPGPLQVGTLAPRPTRREFLGNVLLLQLLPLLLPVPEGLAVQRIRELMWDKTAVGLPFYVEFAMFAESEMPTI